MVALLEPERIEGVDFGVAHSPSAMEHAAKGDSLFDSGKIQSALRQYEAAIVQSPDDAYLHNNRGVALAALGRLDEAADAFMAAESLAPKNPVIPKNLALVFWEQGKHRDAVKAFDRSLALQPDAAISEARRQVVKDGLMRLVKAGKAYWNGEKPRGGNPAEPITLGKSVSDLIIEERDALRG